METITDPAEGAEAPEVSGGENHRLTEDDLRRLEELDKIQKDMEHVRALRDSKFMCVRCTFCGRCKRAKKRRPVNVNRLESL